MNMSVPSEWQVLVSLSTKKTVKLPSHVVNITVHSLSITWCNLYSNSLNDSYCILTCRKAALFMYAIYPFQKYKTLYCTWDIDCKRLFRNVWIILLPMFCLCTLPPCILTPLLPLGCWPWSFPGCSSIVRICNSCVVLCLYAFQLKVHEMHLWAISENWFIRVDLYSLH